ncbi:hypothetical protein HBI01_238650 [Parastagonospora nodorum]|nr:hypothetical protein HBI01_238650 [Parastagonospora nodorum]KAH4319965.1 hypothetical protein HBI00_235600 [Parastagonospora nodorum]
MNVREGYRITTLEVVKLIEDFISYLAVAKCIQLRNAQIPKVFYKAASSSIMSNRSIALITDKFSVALLTKLAILNNANVTLVDAVHYSVVIDALIITLIKDDDDLLGTVNSYIKPPLKRCKTEAADSRYIKVSRGRTKKDKDLENSNTSSDVLRLRRRDRAAAYSLLDSDDYCLDSSLDINSKDDLEDEEATIAKDLLTDAYILYFKELLSNNSRIFANAISISKTRAIVLAVLIRYCNLSNLLALQFCFFSDSSLENIGRLTKEEAIKMRIDTTNAISKALAAANKLVALQSYVLGGFVIVCSFRKVDKYVFRAYNTISVTAQRTIIRKGSFYVEKRAILLSSYQQCRDILEKEGLNKLEASRRVIFNCFKMQAIFKIYSSCKVKRFTLNSIKDLFTNLSKDYFLVREARAITKSSLNIVYFNLDSKLELKVLGKQDVKITS